MVQRIERRSLSRGTGGHLSRPPVAATGGDQSGGMNGSVPPA
jgi:hypothetical protein